MSTWTTREIACGCGERFAARIAVGAHVGRAPQVRTAILDRTFHRFVCRCGKTTAVDVPLEYFDVDRGHLILVGAVADHAAWRAFEHQLEATLLRALQWGSPLASDLVGRLAPRVVFGLEALREKLVLADAGLSDGLIECVKLRAIANDPELSRGRMRVEQVTADDTLLVRHVARRQLVELPASWVHAALRDRASLEARYPDLFGHGFVDIERMWTFDADVQEQL